MRAVIIDVQGRSAAAMKENGEIVRIRNKAYEIGQCVEIKENDSFVKKTSLAKRIKRTGSLAAAAVILTAAGSATAYALPYGTVYLDSVPAVEYTINCFDYVLDISVEGDDISGISTSELNDLKNQKVSEAVKTTIEKIDSSMESDTVQSFNIEAETKNDSHTEKLMSDLDKSLRPEKEPSEDENISIPDNTAPDGNEDPLKENLNNIEEPGPQGTEGPGYMGNAGEETGSGFDSPENNDMGKAPGEGGSQRDEGSGVPFLIHQ